MMRDEVQGVFEEHISGRNPVPWRGAGRMGQRNQIKPVAGEGRAEAFPDDLRQLSRCEELLDCQFSNGDHQPGAQYVHLFF